MLARILYYYAKTLYLKRILYSEEKRIAHQRQALEHFKKHTLSRSPFFQSYLQKPFNEWPICNKRIMMDNFDAMNTLGLKKEEAINIALKAEETRNFMPLLGNISVGLSSGTSGQRGLFIASPQERDAWAGILLAKLLPNGLRTKECIALILRANNRLYGTLNQSKKIQFHFLDLLEPFETSVNGLNQLQPTILVAPASVLAELAHTPRLKIHPKKIVSVAEVLEAQDILAIMNAFSCPVSQVYQCTEGFLGISDPISQRIIMNEEFFLVEKEWLDETRFVPIITDFMRSSQPIVRYRLDDILVADKMTPSVCTQLIAIEGRLGDVCYGQSGERRVPIFADLLRQCVARYPETIDDYQITQVTLSDFYIQVTPELSDPEHFTRFLNQLFLQKQCDQPNWHWKQFIPRNPGHKRRRIQSLLTR